MSRSRGTSVVLVATVLAVLVGGLLAAVGILGFPSVANADEKLYLEAMNAPGENPFAPVAGTKGPVSIPDDPDAEGTKTGVTVENVDCNPAALVETLEADPALAAAWTTALNSDPTLQWSGGTQVRPDQVRAYITELTPQLLSTDLRVTNFQYTKGAPTAVQSVLQAGSSVLVDRAGVVRVRCKCGNPLTPKKQLTTKPAYQGEKWKGYVETDAIVVTHCDPGQRWDGNSCRDIDCRDGYYYDGNACRPIQCDQGEQLHNGHCRPVDCDDGQAHERCNPPRCPGNTNYDGHRCEPPQCPDGKYPVGQDCQMPQCPDGQAWQGDHCAEPACPTDTAFTGSGCAPDPCAQANAATSCTPPCDVGFAWSATTAMCEPAEATTPPECAADDTSPACQKAAPLGQGDTALRNGTPTSTTATAAPTAAPPSPAPCPTKPELLVTDPLCPKPPPSTSATSATVAPSTSASTEPTGEEGGTTTSSTPKSGSSTTGSHSSNGSSEKPSSKKNDSGDDSNSDSGNDSGGDESSDGGN